MKILAKFLIFLINPAKSWIRSANPALILGVSLLSAAAASVLQYNLYSPWAPYPAFFMDISAYMLLRLAYIFGTTFPLMLMAFEHLEEPPLAPGTRVSKIINFISIFILSWAASVLLVRGIQSIVFLKFGSFLYVLFNFMQPAYFMYLLLLSASTIYHLPKPKLLLSVIPFIFIHFLFYFEIGLVLDIIGNRLMQTRRIKLLELIVIVFIQVLPLLIYLVSQRRLVLRGGAASFHARPEDYDLDEISPEMAYEEGIKMMHFGKNNKALEYLNAAIESGKAKTDAWLQRGKLNMGFGLYDKAAEDFETYIDAKPNSVSEEPHILLVQAYNSLKEWDNSLEVVNEMLERFPSNIAGWFLKSETLENLGEEDESLLCLERIEEIWKDMPGYSRKTQKEWRQKAMRRLASRKNSHSSPDE